MSSVSVTRDTAAGVLPMLAIYADESCLGNGREGSNPGGAAGVIETVGGLALLLGLFTRPVAFLASGEMAVAYFKVHFARSVFPINNRGDNVVLFCFVLLYLVFAGGGAWSLDALRSRSRRRSASRGGR